MYAIDSIAILYLILILMMIIISIDSSHWECEAYHENVT
jgi:hypothetical protein